MSLPDQQPVDPAFSRKLVEDDYFRHLLAKHFDSEFKAGLRDEAAKATQEYLSLRWKTVTTLLAAIISVAGLFGYSTWSKLSEELRAQSAKISAELVDFEAKRKVIDSLNGEIRTIADSAKENGKSFESTVKTSLEDARGVVKDYMQHGRQLLDSTSTISEKTFNSLEANVARAASETAQLRTVSNQIDRALKDAEKLRDSYEKKLSILESQSANLGKEMEAMEKRRLKLDEDLIRVEALRQFAATSASEVFALRAREPHNRVTLGLPDLDFPSKRYEITFSVTGLAPPFALAVKVNHPDPGKRWTGSLPIRSAKEPLNIPTLPFLVEMDFLYHTKVAPDFAIMRIRYDPAAVTGTLLKAGLGQ